MEQRSFQHLRCLELGRYRCHQAFPPRPLLMLSLIVNLAHFARARCRCPTHEPGRAALTVSAPQRTPLFPPAIFDLKDSINRRVAHEQCFATHRSPWRPSQQSLRTPGAPFPPPLLRRVSRTFVQEPTPSRECLSDRSDEGHQRPTRQRLNPTRASPCDHTASAVGHVFPVIPPRSISYAMVPVNLVF
jgi:hypothetical protein